MDIILISKRAKDGKITEQRKSPDNVKAFSEGCDMVLKTRLIKGYCIKNAVTQEILYKKGEI
ncbi:hypothetical protein [Treponema sp.]|uniref:hypothetical protein n=1 Tax=Treponema sp. TaxID=166 RepID=UPI00388F8833